MKISQISINIKGAQGLLSSLEEHYLSRVQRAIDNAMLATDRGYNDLYLLLLTGSLNTVGHKYLGFAGLLKPLGLVDKTEMPTKSNPLDYVSIIADLMKAFSPGKPSSRLRCHSAALSSPSRSDEDRIAEYAATAYDTVKSSTENASNALIHLRAALVDDMKSLLNKDSAMLITHLPVFTALAGFIGNDREAVPNDRAVSDAAAMLDDFVKVGARTSELFSDVFTTVETTLETISDTVSQTASTLKHPFSNVID